jgi:hypothetical protein
MSKLAFIFLTRGDLNHPRYWKEFFDTTTNNYYNIYNHPKHPKEISSTSPLYQKCLPNDHLVSNTGWGTTSLIKATNSLLKYAYEDDMENEKFILLSESCIPIRSFEYMYQKLSETKSSYISSFDIKMRPNDKCIKRRYNRFPENSHPVPLEKYRKQSQWMILDRQHVKIILDTNNTFVPLYDHPKVKNADENYYINLLIHKQVSLEEIVNQKKTYKRWTEKDPSHPKTFEHVKPSLIRKIRQDGEDYFFLRKVSPKAKLEHILNFEN